MDRVGNILPRVLRSGEGLSKLADAVVRVRFEELFGDLAAACESVQMIGSTLHIVTNNSALSHQLQIDAQAVIKRLNEGSPTRRVRSLKVQTGRRG